MDGQKATRRSEGVTPSEKFLNELCEKTFLSLWSYAGVHIRELGNGRCRELCDLLVVFENHILIFSDKNCQFQDRGDVYQDWRRWFNDGVMESAKQAWGAESRLRRRAGPLFLDKGCNEPFPLPLPDPDTTTFHRIAVAHNVSKRCRREFGGTGSLVIDPTIVGHQHIAGPDDGGIPFAVGRLDAKKGFVHVLDDTSLLAVMSELDTISDFVAYLSDKERLIEEDRLAWAAGEDDFLAYYLRPSISTYEVGVLRNEGHAQLVVPEGIWAQYIESDFRLAKVEANQVSYVIDRLIESFSGHAIAGTQYDAREPGVASAARTFRFFAREKRTRRRNLGEKLVELVESTPSRRCCVGRIAHPSAPGDPYYVFLALSFDPDQMSYETYREARKDILEAYCLAVKLDYPDAEYVVGIATESGPSRGRSEDAMSMNLREFPDSVRKRAEYLKAHYQIYYDMTHHIDVVEDYPGFQ